MLAEARSLYSIAPFSRQHSSLQQFIQRETCCRALYSVPSSNHAPPELYSLYSVIQRCILYSYTAYTLYSAIQSPSGNAASPPTTTPLTSAVGERVRVFILYKLRTCFIELPWAAWVARLSRVAPQIDSGAGADTPRSHSDSFHSNGCSIGVAHTKYGFTIHVPEVAGRYFRRDCTCFKDWKVS